MKSRVKIASLSILKSIRLELERATFLLVPVQLWWTQKVKVNKIRDCL